LIAAQAALVLVLCVLLYVGLLQPNSPSPLSTGSVPGGPRAETPRHHTHNGSSANGNQLPGPNQTASSPGAHGNGGGNAPLIPGSPPPQAGPPGGPPGPGGDQYSSTVTALKAKLGLVSAGVP